MTLSATRQAEIERFVSAASTQEIGELRSKAELTLHRLNELSSQKLLDAAENEAVHIAIEFLVRIESRDKGGGWWFRLKRRTQLVQTYFGNGNAISAFAIKGEANDRAVRLKTLIDLAAKYLDLSTDALVEAVRRDFPGSQSNVDGDCAGFVFSGAPEFQFFINGIDKEKPARSIMVMGRGELTGYTLYGNEGGATWFSTACKGPLTDATGAAKKLAKTMQVKFGIEDFSRHALDW